MRRKQTSLSQTRLVVGRLLALLVIVFFGVACGADTDQLELAHVTDPIELPVPAGETVLTIRGGTVTNVANRLELDLAGIESLGTITARIDDPFANEPLEITGVGVDRLLGAAGVEPEADLLWVALDDYTVDFSRAAAAAEGAIVVTRVDGQPVEVEDGGPIRVVFPSSEGQLGRDANQWIWSLYGITAG